MAEDPVCHMKVDKARPPGGSYTYKELTYYFCGPGCKRAFEKEPDSYLTGQKKLDMDHH
ncbi:MAG: YHS domain-containing protein [Chloroflexi bacterium]|nr:YHS domain-containing protein [Chloroflexota bacterium]